MAEVAALIETQPAETTPGQTPTINRQPTKETMFRRNFIRPAVVIAALSVALSGCANPFVSNANEQALADMKSNTMEGFTLVGTTEPVCGIDYCNTNWAYDFANESPNENQAGYCTRVISWAKEHGADSWLADGDYVAMPIEGHEGAAQFACVGGLNYSLLGSTGNVRWWVSGGPAHYQIATIMNPGGAIDDERMVFHTWDEARDLLIDESRHISDLLSAIETYRIDNPQADPSSITTIEAALKPLELDPATTIIEDKGGKAHYLILPAGQFMLELCINITPYDPEYFGAPNPGNGFIPLYLAEDAETIDEFGYFSQVIGRGSVCPAE